MIQIVPGISWDHSGSSAAHTQSNIYSATLAARMGLPVGVMIGASVPYAIHAHNTYGSNSGLGDASFSLWKELMTRTRSRPSLVAAVSYIAPTGSDPFESAVPLGSGFHTVQAALYTVKVADPLAFYGNASYAHPFARKVSGQELEAGDSVGVQLGSTLAATPETAFSLGMNFAFVGKNKNNGVSIAGTDRTVGLVDIGIVSLLSRNIYLSLSSQIGVTADAPDLGVNIALPIRF